MSPASTEQFLLEQYTGHPASQLQDLRKALYQSVFGCGHLITDTSAAEGIRREAAEAGPCSREIEALDGPWSRVHLGVLADGLTPETLSRIFARSAAMPHGGADTLQEKLTVLRRLIHSGALPYSPAEADAELDDWRKNGFPACRHSEEYRAAYRPAYRVLHRTYVRLLPLLAAIDRALAENPRVLLAIEGGAASGKSTLADLLTAIYPDTVLFHADDFFLRPEQRTAARYAQPGGNLDRERLESEILAPISRNEVAIYRPFDCRTLSLQEPVTVLPGRLNIVEGSYSFHPELARYYDLSVFLDISPETQRSRILERNGPEWGQQFFDRWIPLEQTYFHETDTQGRCTLALKEETR